VDVKRAADLYAQGRTLRQIGSELGVPWTATCGCRGLPRWRAGKGRRMRKPSDLNPTQRKSYDLWRDLGLTEAAAMNALVEDGVVRLSEEEKLARRFSSSSAYPKRPPSSPRGAAMVVLPRGRFLRARRRLRTTSRGIAG
jgi:hypothetical protein